MKNKKALVIDGNSLIFRAFYATLNQLDYYKNHNLLPVNALKLVLQIVLKLTTETNYDYVLMALDHKDGKQALKRTELFHDYKAGRHKTPEELIQQIPLIEQAMNIIGVNTLSISGVEADDIIGSFAKLTKDNSIPIDIYSSDRDMLQLVDNLTSVNLFKTGISNTQKITIENFNENFFGLFPTQVVDFKGISGDHSDNLCGVKGIGPKTASELIKKYGSLEEIYVHLDDLTASQKEKFLQSKEHAFLCKRLSTIQTNVLDDKTINDFVKKPIDEVAINSLINKYRFSGFEKYLTDLQKSLF
ncbi:MAG: 5'-3' exonuclease [Mycoplasmataceae bacterium]|jgi:DNA polymerase-1|nr:5'-3' exonuclease [Mycoplasmataceae bacterium]